MIILRQECLSSDFVPNYIADSLSSGHQFLCKIKAKHHYLAYCVYFSNNQCVCESASIITSYRFKRPNANSLDMPMIFNDLPIYTVNTILGYCCISSIYFRVISVTVAQHNPHIHYIILNVEVFCSRRTVQHTIFFNTQQYVINLISLWSQWPNTLWCHIFSCLSVNSAHKLKVGRFLSKCKYLLKLEFAVNLGLFLCIDAIQSSYKLSSLILCKFSSHQVTSCCNINVIYTCFS